MECNKDEAARAKALAERKLLDKDFVGAKKLIIKAQKLSKEVDDIDIPKMLTVCDVHCAAGAKENAKVDWYGILQVPETADEALIKKQYHKLALLLHPDKNKFGGAEAAFKLVGEASKTLTDRSKRSLYDMERVRATQTTFWTICPSCGTRYQYYISVLKKTVCCQNQSCSKRFIARDLKEQAVPYGAKQRSARANFNVGSHHAGGNSKRKTDGNTAGPKDEMKSDCMTRNPSKASSTAGLKRGRRVVLESSESSISETSSDSEEERAVGESSISETSSDSEEEIADHGPAVNDSGPGQGPRRSSRQKQEVKYNEEKVDGDFVNSPSFKRLRKSVLFCSNDSRKMTKLDEEIAGHNGTTDGANNCSRTEDEREGGAPCREKTLSEIEQMKRQRGFCTWLGQRNRSPRLPKLGTWKCCLARQPCLGSKPKRSTMHRLGLNSDDDSDVIPHGDTLRSSHCVPHHVMSGTEKEGIPEKCLERDPAVLPLDLEEDFPSIIPESSSVRSKECDAKCTGSSIGNSSRTGSMNVGKLQHTTCMNAGIATETPKEESSKHNTCSTEVTDVDDGICQTIYVHAQSEFYDFSQRRLLHKVLPGKIWAFYSDIHEFPNYYGFIQKVDLNNGKLQVRWLDVYPRGEEEKRLLQEEWTIGCGTFRISSVHKLMTYNDTNAFSHCVESRSTGQKGEYEIIPHLGEIWALYKDWRAGWTARDFGRCEYELVEILGHNDSSIQVHLLRKVIGYKTVFMRNRAEGSVKTIRKDEYPKFSHQIPCFHLTHEKGGKLRGYLELDPFSLPGPRGVFLY